MLLRRRGRRPSRLASLAPQGDGTQVRSTRFPEPIVERIAGATYGTDRVDGVAAIERLAQAADMDVDGALVDIDVAAPYPVEQLLAREHPAGTFHQKFEQAELRRAELDRPSRARHALFLA